MGLTNSERRAHHVVGLRGDVASRQRRLCGAATFKREGGTMALKPDLHALQRSVRRWTRSRNTGLLAVLLCASTLILVVSTRRSHSPRGGPPLPLGSSAVTTLAGAPERTPSAGGEIEPAQQRRLAPQVGHALIRYFRPQSAKPP